MSLVVVITQSRDAQANAHRGAYQPPMPITFNMALRAYGMYDKVYQVYARYSTMTKTK